MWLLLLLLLWGKVALANARDLSGSRERMHKSTLSFPKCCCLFITVAEHFNQCPTVSGSSLHLLHVGDVFSSGVVFHGSIKGSVPVPKDLISELQFVIIQDFLASKQT